MVSSRAISGEIVRVYIEGILCACSSVTVSYDIDGIPVLMKDAHGIYLMGMEVDYSDGLNARGFVFKNPNASSSCGCGSSFAV